MVMSFKHRRDTSVSFASAARAVTKSSEQAHAVHS